MPYDEPEGSADPGALGGLHTHYRHLPPLSEIRPRAEAPITPRRATEHPPHRDDRPGGDRPRDRKDGEHEPDDKPTPDPKTSDNEKSKGNGPDKKGEASVEKETKEGDEEADPRKKEADARKARRRKIILYVVLGIVLIAAIVGAIIWWLATKDQVSTDDAYTDGRAVTIAPKVSGYVTELDVNDNQRVSAGQVLLRIDQRDYLASRDQARAAVLAAEGQLDAARAGLELARVTYPAKLDVAKAQREAALATLTRAQADAKRQNSVPRAATTQQNVDEATAGQRSAQASVAEAEANVRQASPVEQNLAQAAAQVKQLEGQVQQARAQLATAELNLSYTVVTAPQDGWITKRNVELGNYATPGSSIMSLVSPEVWVIGNFKESQLERMRPQQQVEIRVDAYPSLKLHGHLDSWQLGSGSKFTAFPPENATGNYVKIVQRLPVKIAIDSGLDPTLPLPLGLSVTPTVMLK